MRIDLNADMGEGFGPYRMGRDEELLHIVTSANVACGFHGGDVTTQRSRRSDASRLAHIPASMICGASGGGPSR